ncbi:caspase-3-like [Mytilus californianus]|uniref:caspase-3-like n=1 Tax=Mytilus californianus TaxID=6549 RepID=UPI0022474A27|nr:caspase-3-like [Mytilus californianus]XP_052095500.1 caspase-3-like [Mytilus californianus]XP_052095501.1 caspase-3-like [Mytilus californianus]
MAVDPRKALIKNRVAIVRDLDNGDDVADYLYTVKLFTEDMRDTVLQEPEKEKKNRLILDTLGRRGQKAAKGLHDAFLETENNELAKLLAPYIRVIESEENRFSPKEWPPINEEQNKMQKDSVRRITDLKSPSYIHEYTDKQVYEIRNKTRGKVFIINNVKFQVNKLSHRHGSEVDAENIKSLFTELHFDVVQKDNLTGQEMLKFLKEERDKVNWNTMECLILVIMSHGETTGIFGTDGQIVELKKITEMFESSQCSGLNEKPRLVFVQACRGENTESDHTGTGIQVSDKDGVSEGIQAISLETEQTDAVAQAHNEDSTKRTVHSAADFLIAYATPEGTPAYRNIHVGSWFLNAIVWTFKYHAHQEEIQHMLLKVNELVSQGRTMAGNLTVSEVKSNLRKKFYFFPGVYDDPPKFIDS